MDFEQTRRRRGSLEFCWIRLACANLIEGTASAHDAALSKPAPDIVQAALRKSGGDARAAIMIGDTPYDVEAPLRGQIIIVRLRKLLASR